MTPLNKLNGVVIDVESGGLDPSVNALLEIGLIAVREGQPIATWNVRVIPHPGLTIVPEAAAVNGYHPDTWGGSDERAVIWSMIAWLQWVQATLKRKQLTWIGNNTPFDQSFLQYAARRHGAQEILVKCFSHRDVDMGKLAMIPFLSGAWRGVGMDVMCRELKVGGERGTHTALNDCERSLQCLHAFMARITWNP